MARLPHAGGEVRRPIGERRQLPTVLSLTLVMVHGMLHLDVLPGHRTPNREGTQEAQLDYVGNLPRPTSFFPCPNGRLLRVFG